MTYDAVVLGAGGWGTALAILLADNGRRVGLWARRPEFAEELRLVRENRPYLPGVTLPLGLEPGGDLATMLQGAKLVILAAPSHGLREVVRRAAPDLADGVTLVSATKGLEQPTDLRMSQVVAEELGSRAARLAVVSGPNFSAEVARGQPTATVVAASSRPVAEAVQDALMSGRFRVYTNPDVAGVELCGALKNVYAIAVGISDGLGLGNNTRAAVITRALAEMTRLGGAVGAQPMTFAGLAGLGDLVLTCTGDLSRNRRAGLRLGRGEPVEAVTDAAGMVIEGVRTAVAACSLAKRVGVELPIAEQVVAVLDGKAPAEAVSDLMTRDPRHEIEEVVSPPLDWKP
ncbi:MAG: NAD(P)H-dependent glycerol-3-phosphate dehydrogenase [Bacillota bacterium]